MTQKICMVTGTNGSIYDSNVRCVNASEFIIGIWKKYYIIKTKQLFNFDIQKNWILTNNNS